MQRQQIKVSEWLLDSCCLFNDGSHSRNGFESVFEVSSSINMETLLMKIPVVGWIDDYPLVQPQWGLRWENGRDFIFLFFILFFFNFEFYFIYFFIQQVLISHPFYTHQCIHVNPNHTIHPTTTTPRRFPPLMSLRLFSTSVSLFLPCKPVHLYHFSRFHIHALIYVICFSLSDFLHSVWQSLDPSTSLQMTQFCSFLWLSNIPLYIYTTSLSIRLLMGI